MLSVVIVICVERDVTGNFTDSSWEIVGNSDILDDIDGGVE